MKKVKLLVQLFFIGLSSFESGAQVEHNIGDGSSQISDSIPMFTARKYSYSQQIFFEEELAAAGIVMGDTITGIKLYYSANGTNTSVTTWNNLDIYLANVEMDGFTTNNSYVAGISLTECYTGILDPVTDNSWFLLDFNTSNDFVYNGGDLILAVDENSSTGGGFGANGSAHFKTFEVPSNGNFLYLNYSPIGNFAQNPDPGQSITANITSLTKRNQVKFITSCPSIIPTPLVNGAIACPSSSAELSIIESESSFSYNWYDESVGGNLLGTGISIIAPTNTPYYVEAILNGCGITSDRTMSMVESSPVYAEINTFSPTCDGGTNGGFNYTDVYCGEEPLIFSINGGPFAPAPDNLTFGTYSVVMKDANNIESPEIAVVIEQSFDLEPSDLQVTSISDESVTITWTSNGSEDIWGIEWGTVGFEPGQGQEEGSITTNDTIGLINGLQPGSLYDIYVSAQCGLDPVWIPVTVETYCQTAEALFCEDFELSSETVDCWKIVELDSNPGTWEVPSEIGIAAIDGYGAYFSNNFSTSESWLISPWITLTGNEFLQFDIQAQENGQFDTIVTQLEVWISTTGRSVGDFETIILDASETNYINVNNDFVTDTVDLTAYTGNVFIAFRAIDNYSSWGNLDYTEFMLDNICINVCHPEESIDGTIDVCQEAQMIDLLDVITPGESFGEWYDISNNNVQMDSSALNVATMELGTYNYMYIVSGGCDTDTSYATLNIVDVNSGTPTEDMVVCKNQPLNLFDGLTGDYSENGIWLDESEDEIPSSMIVSASLGGSHEFTYLVEATEFCNESQTTITVNVNGACDYLGIDGVMSKMFQISPNPTSGFVTIKSNIANQELNYIVMDINGRKVGHSTIMPSQINEGTVIDISALQDGTYFIRFNSGAENEVHRVIKQSY